MQEKWIFNPGDGIDFDSLSCPNCQQKLVKGELVCGRSVLTPVITPIIDIRLWSFEGAGASSAKVLASSKRTPALRCPHCELIVFAG